jgi:hypothetical protein
LTDPNIRIELHEYSGRIRTSLKPDPTRPGRSTNWNRLKKIAEGNPDE